MFKRKLEDDLIKELNIPILDFYVKHKKKMDLFRGVNNQIIISYKSKKYTQEQFEKYLEDNENPSGIISPLDNIYTDVD